MALRLPSLGSQKTHTDQYLNHAVQMDSSSVPIAIGEPIGGGLFVSNIVLGVVVLLSGGARGAVPVERRAFLRDCGFYAGSMVVVGVVLYDEQVRSSLSCVHDVAYVFLCLFDGSFGVGEWFCEVRSVHSCFPDVA